MSQFPRHSDLPSPTAAPPLPELHRSVVELARAFDSTYWKQLCPELSVGKHTFSHPSAPLESSALEEYRGRMREEGFFQYLPPPTWGEDVAPLLARNIVQLQQYGWPASFIFMYDEAWEMHHHAVAVLSAVTGTKAVFDVLAWYVDPSSGQAGFTPHRDRQPPVPRETFSNNGMPHYATCWLALTDACPDNSCLYVLPKQYDPGYLSGDDMESDLDPLDVAMASKEHYQHIRALPCPAGAAAFFSHRIIHWGSRGRVGYKTPRIAISFVTSEESFEPPYVGASHLPFPSVEVRARLVAGQMLVYHERFQFSLNDVGKFRNIFNGDVEGASTAKTEAVFSKEYIEKVELDFISAVRDADSRRPVDGEGDEEDQDEELLEAALEAMLDADMKGGIEFDDDYEGDDDDIARGDDDSEDGDGDEEEGDWGELITAALPQKRKAEEKSEEKAEGQSAKRRKHQ